MLDSVTVVFLAYLAAMFLVAWFFSRHESLEEYFLNARKSGLWLLVCSNVATVIGAGATVAVVAEGCRSGISFGLASVSSYLTGALIMIWLAPKIYSQGAVNGIATIVDYFSVRFDRRVGAAACVVQLFVLVVWVAVQAAATAGLSSALSGLGYDAALLLSAAAIIGYTALGGLKIDIITDFLQFWTMGVVFAVFAFLGCVEVGGAAGLVRSLPAEKWSPLAFGGAGWFAGAVVLGGFIYPANSCHWQRLLSARDVSTARRALFLSLPLLALFGGLMLFFGQIAAVLLPGTPGDRAFFDLLRRLSPSPLLLGAGYAAVLATIMSSIDSLVVAGSTVVYKVVFGALAEQGGRMLLLARLFTGVFGFAGFLLAYLVPAIVTLSLFVVYAALIFVPPLLAGFFSGRFSAKGALWALLMPAFILLFSFPLMPKYAFVATTLAGAGVIAVDLLVRRQKGAADRTTARDESRLVSK